MSPEEAGPPHALLQPELDGDRLTLTVPQFRYSPPSPMVSGAGVLAALVCVVLAALFGSAGVIAVALGALLVSLLLPVITAVATTRVVLQIGTQTFRIEHYTQIGRLWQEELALHSIRGATYNPPNSRTGAPARIHVPHEDGDSWIELAAIPEPTALWLTKQIEAAATHARQYGTRGQTSPSDWLPAEIIAQLERP